MGRLILLCLALSGCAGDALTTLPAPGEGDCQYRAFEGSGGGGFGASVSGSLKVLTIIGPAECRDAETVRAIREAL